MESMVAVYKYSKSIHVMKRWSLTENMKKMRNLKQSHTFKVNESVVQVFRRKVVS